MKLVSLLAVLLVPACALGQQGPAPTTMRSIQEFNVLPTNDPATNKANLQKAIDWAATCGAALYVTPSETPYPVSSGLVLKMNASLVGPHGPTGRGTKHPTKDQPVGAVFSITDTDQPFITVESATQLRGIQFYYPNQELHDPKKVIEYPPTVAASKTHSPQGVTLSCLTFYGEFVAFDFACSRQVVCEQILFEHCYGYPLSGQFIRIDYCYDIPRILHCHVNPANMRLFHRHYSKEVLDSVVARKTFAYSIDHTDNAQVIDVFTFATYGGIRLGAASYGQLTNFNFDCVTVGVHKLGENAFNRNWQIAQGSIIANTSPSGDLSEVHPIVVEGRGNTSLSNVEAFSGDNPVLTNLRRSQDFLLVRGEQACTVTVVGSRMRNYAATRPISVEDPKAVVQAVACVDKDEHPFNQTVAPSP